MNRMNLDRLEELVELGKKSNKLAITQKAYQEHS